MGLVFVQSALRAAQRPVVLLTIFLDHPFQRTVRNVCIADSKQSQVRQHSSESSIAILKRMNCEKPYDERGDHEKRVVLAPGQFGYGPAHEFLHQPRGIGGTRRLKYHTNAAAVLIERFNIVRMLFVVAAMVLVAIGVLQKDSVKLLDVVLR